ncbi:hypothetical protein MMC07_000543 [Pseudocyphellaria aurata]|nr:hypothetical protein [Pseudocyphellaria aurata]
MATHVTGVILPAGALAAAVAQSAVALVDADGSLKNKNHWMQCNVRNKTQFEMILQDSYFDSGEYYNRPPQNIEKYSHGTFSAGSKWGFAGMSGGNWWKLNLDHDTAFKFSLGYTDPVSGDRKSSAVPTDGNAEDGYNAATERGTSGRSPVYRGADKDGNEIYFVIEVTSVTGDRSTFTVRQEQIKWE